MNLTIKLSEGKDDFCDVTIHGVNFPPPSDPEEFIEWDKKWRNISNGIHALIAHLEPPSEKGWYIEFWCEDK